MIEAEIAVNQRADGIWVVILARAGTPPMEFTCESERQARAFAESLQSSRQSYGAIAAERTRVKRPEPRPLRGWFGGRALTPSR